MTRNQNLKTLGKWIILVFSLGGPGAFASAPQVIFSKPGFYDGALWDPSQNALLFTAYGKNGNKIFRWKENSPVKSWDIPNWTIAGLAHQKAGGLIGADFRNHVILSFALGNKGLSSISVRVKMTAPDHFNQPNDLVEASNGWIYASDPDFKTRKESKVWGFAPDGKSFRLVNSIKVPNGIAVSPDSKTIYVSDSLEKIVYAFEIEKNGQVDEKTKRVFFAVPQGNEDEADGVSIDQKGTLYLVGRGAIWEVTPKGICTGRVVMPVFCSKVSIGGKKNEMLFASCKNAVYRIPLPLPKPAN